MTESSVLVRSGLRSSSAAIADRSATPRRVALGVAALLVIAVALGTGWMAWAAPPRDDVLGWLAVLALELGALGVAGALVWGARPARLGLVVLAGAAALRLTLVAAPPSLSDDLHRYVWDGALIAHGVDPFESRPRDVVGSAGLTEDDLAQINSPDYFSVYPPLAQAAFALGGLAERLGGDGATSLRAVFVAADLAGVAVLLMLLARLGRDPRWALFYAWNPVVAWEVASSGHTEALVVAPLLLAALAAHDDRARAAGVWIGLAAAAKLSALVFAPVLVVHILLRRGVVAAATTSLLCVGALGASYLPFASLHLLPHVLESMSLWAMTFSFDAPVYYALRHWLGYREGLTPPVDDLVMPALGVLALTWVTLCSIAPRGDKRRLWGALAWVFVGYLLLSRVIHPWYVLPALALATVSRDVPILLLATLLPLSYLRYDGLGYESPWIIALQFVPVVAYASARAVRSARAAYEEAGASHRGPQPVAIAEPAASVSSAATSQTRACEPPGG